MSTLSFTQSEYARKEALNFVQQSLPAHLWNKNVNEVQPLKQICIEHPLFQHPILTRLNSQNLSLDQLKLIHLNYFTAIVKTFTDTLSMLIYQALQLEQHDNIHETERVHAKSHARYLLSLNLIDELGFNTHQLSLSSPTKSHLIYYLDLLKLLQIDPINSRAVVLEAHTLNQFMQPHLSSYNHLLLILACAELQVIQFSEALRINLEKYNPQFTEGYYACHGVVDPSQKLANDNNHEDDLWALLTQSYHSDQQPEYEQLIKQYLQLWENFWSKMHQMTL
jgi:hypothetical protein